MGEGEEAMTPPRQGPTLTIAGSCEGCALLGRAEAVTHCMHDDTKKRADSGIVSFTGRDMPAGHDSSTPAWCPLLPAARLALARGIVEEAGRE